MITSVTYKTIIFAALGGLLPSALWLWFWLKEDKNNPEPKRLIAITFLLGGLGVIAAFYLEQMVAQGFNIGSLDNIEVSFSDFGGISKALPFFYLFLAWALIEEGVKYVAALILALRSRFCDEPVDAMVYMITAALGFAAVENSLFLLKTVRTGMSGFDFAMTGNLRFIGATLLHIFSSALIGAFIGLSLSESGNKRIKRTLAGILLATLLHALFNFFIIIDKGKHIFFVLITLWFMTVLVLMLFEKVKHKKNISYVQR